MRKKAYRYTKDDYVFVYQMLVLRSQGWSYPKIGQAFNKDHSTVIHWCRRFSIDIGKPVMTYEEFDNNIHKRPPALKHKYLAILEEPINVGKRSYAEYLKAEKERQLARSAE